MKKRLPLILLFVLLAAAAFLQAAEPVGMVVALQGSAVAAGLSGDSRELAMASDIFLNDTIQTGPASRIQLLLNDDSLIAQGERSEMTIDEYIYNPDKASENGFGVKLGKGIFRTVTGKITDLNPERFAVKTSRAVIGIRGCDLGFEITPDEDRIAIITVPEGKEIVINPLNGDQSLVVGEPRFVAVDDRGTIQQRELTSTDRSMMQQGTTPGAAAPGVTPLETLELPGGGDSLMDQGSILQDTIQDAIPSDTHHHP
jgi:hypothetical protein